MTSRGAASGTDNRSTSTTLVTFIAAVALAGLLALCALLIADAGLRFAGDTRIHGLRDMEEFLFAVIIAACFPISIIRREHIRVRLWSRAGTQRVAAGLDLFGDLCLCLVFLGLAAGLAWLAADWQRAGRWTATLQYPLAPWVGLSALLIATAGLLQLRLCIALLRRLRNADDGNNGD